MGDGFGGEGFARSLGSHQQHPPGHGQAVALSFLAEGPVALVEPMLEGIQAADVGGGGFAGAVLQQFTFGDGLALLFQHLGQILAAQATPAGQGPGSDLAHPLLTEAMAGGGELLQNRRIQGHATGPGDRAQ